MVDDIDLAPKVSCGIWTTLEMVINRESSGKFWDKNEVWQKSLTVKKKEKPKTSKFLMPSLESMTTFGDGEPSLSSRRSSGRRHRSTNLPNPSFNQPANRKFPTSARNCDAAVISCKKCDTETEVELEMCHKQPPAFVDPLVNCSFNLPRVSAQLERLMGTNVVHLTDRKYMMELRRRIHEDFNDMLTKRIQNREAKEMQRQRNLLMEGKLTKCPKELSNHPEFMINQPLNTFVVKRRAKLKTKRERNAERLIRLGKKWEKKRLIFEQKEREREEEMKAKEMEMLVVDNKFAKSRASRGVKFSTIKDKTCVDSEMDLEIFLKNENDLMADRLKSKETKFDPYTKDLRIVDAKRRLSEASRPKLKTLVARITSNLVKMALNKSKQNVKANDEVKQESSDDETNDDHNLNVEGKPLNEIYVDPMVEKLKKTNNVKDMYALAEEIVGCIPDKYFDKKIKSGEHEELAV